MQTFIPYSNFIETARCLDRLRLGKQRVETLQIMDVLLGDNTKKGWRNHPAVKMWKGYELALLRYQEAICKEWTSRGYKDTCLEKTRKIYFIAGRHESLKMPHWWNDEAIHASHRSNLLRKMPEWYNKYCWTESDDLEYVWPV